MSLNKQYSEMFKYLSLVTQIGLYNLIYILSGFFLGFFINKYFPNYGISIVIGILLGVIGGFYQIYNMIIKIQKDNHHKKK